jgi:hypothetical protein
MSRVIRNRTHLAFLLFAPCVLASCATTGAEAFARDDFLDKNIAIAIYDFTETGKNYESDLSIYLRDRVEAELAKKGNITVCARDKDLSTVLEEIELDVSGITTERRNEQILGRLVNADYTLAGEITRDRAGGATLSLKYVEVESGSIDHVFTIAVPKREIDAVYRKGIRGLPSEYYDSLVYERSEEIAARLRPLMRPQTRVFLAVTDQRASRMSFIDTYIYSAVKKNLAANGIPLQKNLVSEENTFPTTTSVAEALRTMLYSKYQYYVVEISHNEADQYYQYFTSAYRIDDLRAEMIVRTEMIIEKNGAIVALQKIK